MTVLGTLPNKPKVKVNPIVILRILQVITLLIFGVLVYGIFLLSRHYKNLETLSKNLEKTSMYTDAKNSIRSQVTTASSDQKAQFIKSLQQKENLVEVIELNKVAETQYNQTLNYLTTIQMPYENLLYYYLLPPLNIWKNRFTGKIDEAMIGQKYLKNNEYLDVNLINKWTNFFKDIGNDSPKNEIKTINIGEVTEFANGTFTIAIDVSFIAQTKRSFLLLLDKVSTTSNKENLGLMNEFFYNLWVVIKEKEMGGSGSVTTGGILTTSVTGDEQIGINIYKRVMDSNSTYINNQDILTAMKRFANCETNDEEECYFNFREKMRNIPSLAYTLGLSTTNKSNELRLFLQNLPPLMDVKSFTFKKMSSANNREENRPYEGTITLEAYGKSMSMAEVDEIATYLGSICLFDSSPMSPGGALNQLERTIKQATQISQFSNEKSQQLNDLKDAINNINASYGGLPGLKKVVSLFELYRMLLDNGLCTSKK